MGAHNVFETAAETPPDKKSTMKDFFLTTFGLASDMLKDIYNL